MTPLTSVEISVCSLTVPWCTFESVVTATIDARCPPADIPHVMNIFGSKLSSLALARRKRMAAFALVALARPVSFFPSLVSANV